MSSFLQVRGSTLDSRIINTRDHQHSRSSDGKEELTCSGAKERLHHILRDGEGHRTGPVPGPAGASGAASEPTAAKDAETGRKPPGRRGEISRRGRFLKSLSLHYCCLSLISADELCVFLHSRFQTFFWL